MRANRWFAMGVVLVLAGMGALSSAYGQAEPEKRPGPEPLSGPTATKPGAPQPGPVGAPEFMSAESARADVDSSVQRMARLTSQAQVLSESFRNLAALHHGADKSEILMMQRMSDAMGTMAEELGATFEQYKRLLDDETADESGTMRAEVEELEGVMNVIGGQIDEALRTLQRLQSQLGQG